MVNLLINCVHTARHGLIGDSLNSVVVKTALSIFYVHVGNRTRKLGRSRNKVVVGEPAAGEFEG